MIGIFLALIALSILAEILFWNYWHHFLAEQLALITGVNCILVLTGALLFIYFKSYKSDDDARDILWGTIFALVAILVVTALLSVVEILLH